MRAYIAQLMASDAQLLALGLPANGVYAAENVDTPPAKPFIVYRMTGIAAEAARRSPSQPHDLDVWVYDERGDYTRIDAICARLRSLLPSVVAQRTETGWITQIDWTGEGGDGYDDVWETISRTTSFRVIGSYVS